MTEVSTSPLDGLDWKLLAELQRNARIPIAELGRRVNLGSSATADRVRRLQESGVISGFRAEIDLDRVGYPILAFVRLRYPTGNYRPLHAELDHTQEILECHHVTGEDCFVLKVAASSMAHLEQLTGRLATLGTVATSVVYSSTLASRVLTDPASR